MKNYEFMTVGELVILVRLQDRIINSLRREMKISRADKRKRSKTLNGRGPAFRRNVSVGRLEKVSPERRKEISRLGQKARLKKKAEREAAQLVGT